MKLPFWSKDRILKCPKVACAWLPKAVDTDSGSDLDRAISLNSLDKIFARDLMPDEIETQLTGATIVKGDDKALLEVTYQMRRDMICKNAKLVIVVDRKRGIRFRDYIFVFEKAGMFVEVDGDIVRGMQNAIRSIKLPV